MDEELKKYVSEQIERYVGEYMDKQKDNLLIQLIGFLEDEKHETEKKLGSGEVQKIEKYNYTEMREANVKIPEVVEEEDDEEETNE